MQAGRAQARHPSCRPVLRHATGTNHSGGIVGPAPGPDPSPQNLYVQRLPQCTPRKQAANVSTEEGQVNMCRQLGLVATTGRYRAGPDRLRQHVL